MSHSQTFPAKTVDANATNRQWHFPLKEVHHKRFQIPYSALQPAYSINAGAAS